jgi:hypothetical protein
MPELEIPIGPTARTVRLTYDDVSIALDMSIVPDGTHGRWKARVSTEIGYTVWFDLKPDPARAAVQAERERCKAEIDVLWANRQWDKASLGELKAAIDAPNETPSGPSEYKRGTEDIERQVFELLELRIQQRYLADNYAAQRQALKNFAECLRREWHMEPPPATEPTP